MSTVTDGPVVEPGRGVIYQGDVLEKLKELEPDSIDAIITDPPYELGFMGKALDSAGVSFKPETWAACLRVLKPGGHLLAFGGTRTYHRIVVAIEDAGFQIRDQIAWIYGQGFPKSRDISKEIDKAAGAERKVIGYNKDWINKNKRDVQRGQSRMNANMQAMGLTDSQAGYQNPQEIGKITAPATDNAKKWEGWGTGLKPSMEPICLARKQLSESTVAANVLKWGTGALNIDGSRIGTESRYNESAGNKSGGNSLNMSAIGMPENADGRECEGRWPANLIHDGSEEVERGFPSTHGAGFQQPPQEKWKRDKYNGVTDWGRNKANGARVGDSGSTSRFFYTAKASKWERENHNKHPTVKPIALMEYLIKLVTPKGGVVLDPFCGSGSTLIAAKKLGHKYIGIDFDPESIETTKLRLQRAAHEPELFV